MKLNMIYYISRQIYFTFLVTFIKNLNAKKKKKKNLLSCLTIGRLLPETTNSKNSSLIMEKKVFTIFLIKNMWEWVVLYIISYPLSFFIR